MERKKERKLNIDKKKMNKAEWGDLPKDSVRLIMEKLVWSDNFRMSLICKSWQECLHEIENTQEFLPWMMSYNSSDQSGDGGGICKLYDPVAKRSYIVEAPILKGASPCQSKNGWVFFSKPIFNAMCYFFYSPFTYEVIELPKAEKKSFRKTMFSLSPSSPNCMIGSFNIKKQEWKVLSEPSPSIDYYDQYFFVAFNGDLILCTFDISNTKWEFVEDERQDGTTYLLSVPAVGNAKEATG
ncbi:hypothetical protein EZV62_006900 [Acer yangbiense]|uniref:F-box domain-containing protein n=1 Tax=Acer yangbiense TaxID=1000413 RepID=A0A5C7I8S6_9ROSI|nr:hypothetical protein EZV62_006900 [Acer yangbiense]